MRGPVLISIAIVILVAFIFGATVPDDATLKENADDYVTDHLMREPTRGLPITNGASVEIADYGVYKQVRYINKGGSSIIGYGYLNGFHPVHSDN